MTTARIFRLPYGDKNPCTARSDRSESLSCPRGMASELHLAHYRIEQIDKAGRLHIGHYCLGSAAALAHRLGIAFPPMQNRA